MASAAPSSPPLLFSLSYIHVSISPYKSYCQRTACIFCVCVCVLLLLESRLFCVCGLCLGVSVSHLLCFFGWVRSCFIADAEHKDALSGVWTIGQVWRYWGNRDLCMHTHAHTLSLSLRAVSVEGSRGPGGLSFSPLIMTVWQDGKQEVREGKMERGRNGR